MGSLELSIREAGAADLPFLESMLALAATWRGAPRGARQDPMLDRYLEDWGRAGDVARIAEIGGASVGAAWWRLFSSDRPGYGFVADDIPEISLAVAEGRRRLGIGRSLLDALLAEAEQFGVSLSLSVELDNPAVGLYRAAGFEPASASDGSATMVWSLPDG